MEGRRRYFINASALVALLGLVYVVGGVTLWVTELAPESGTTHRALYQLVVHVLFGGVILALGATSNAANSSPRSGSRCSSGATAGSPSCSC